jgi:hypothetical protein
MPASGLQTVFSITHSEHFLTHKEPSAITISKCLLTKTKVLLKQDEWCIIFGWSFFIRDHGEIDEG